MKLIIIILTLLQTSANYAQSKVVSIALPSLNATNVIYLRITSLIMFLNCVLFAASKGVFNVFLTKLVSYVEKGTIQNQTET